jgi:hypothetical protein
MRTSSVPNEHVVFPRMLFCDSRCTKSLPGFSLVLSGFLGSNVTCRMGDGERVILHQRVQGSVRAVSAIWNTQLFQTETRAIADVVLVGCVASPPPDSWF